MSGGDVAEERGPTAITRGWLQMRTAYRLRSRPSTYFFDTGK